MKQDMRLRQIIRVLFLMLALLMGAGNEVWADITAADIVIRPVTPTSSGTVVIAKDGSDQDLIEHITSGDNQGWKVTITVTPADGFMVKTADIKVEKLVNTSDAQTRGVTPDIANELTVTSESGLTETDEAGNYYFTIPEGYGGALVTVTFTSMATPGYYVLHQNGKGYLNVYSANVTLGNKSDLKYTDVYSDDGNAFWVMTSDGYLQNNVYYLNVTPVSNELYLSVKPVTRWRQEDITGDEHGKKHIMYNGLYLCNESDKVKLSASPSAYYNACPVSITENNKDNKKWTGPTSGDLNVQSPQLVTYLRYYFTQQIDYVFYDDGGTKKSETCKNRYVYAKLEYASGGADKGTKWDITSDGIIYSKQTGNDVAVTATYNLLPADAEALKLHGSATQKSIKLTLKPQAFAPDAQTNYLLYSIPGGDSYRFPYDDNIIAVNSAVKSNGAKTALTDPDVNGGNPEISWKIERDDNGLYTFKNVNSGRYFYYNDALGDYGTICVGATTLPTGDGLKKYKFRLYQTSATDFGTCYCIIPYDKQFAVYKNDALAGSIYCAMNVKNYTSDNSISLRYGNDDSKWRIYAYEAEYRVNDDFRINGENTASTTGNYTLTAETFYYKIIVGSPVTGTNKRALEINGSYDTSTLVFPWSMTGLDGYATYSHAENNNNSKSTLTISVTSLPVSSVSGTVSLKVKGGTDPIKYSSNKTFAFTILGDGTLSLTDITSLSAIESSSGAYRLTTDQTYSEDNKPRVTTFSGILDCDGHTITDLTAPLFTTLSNGTVRNVNLSGVNISQNGAVGAIASTANGGSRIYNVGILDGSVGSTGTSTANNGTDCCGGIVGLLDGSARVINCFSYAEILGGNSVGGIVGYNNYASKRGDIRTMVMNCMFYGDIKGGRIVSPVYGGNNINNVVHDSDRNSDGLNTFNYYAYDKLKTKPITDKKYNCALAVEEKYLNHFEFYRLLLNSNKKLAAFYALGDVKKADQMKKWVLETADRTISNPKPYPILKAQGYYPSIINIDVENAPTSGERNTGKQLGTLDVTISESNTTNGGQTKPSGATVETTSLKLTRTDKDFDRFNYNYDKVQLPYYNDVGTGNYTGNRVVTGWKITAINAVEGDPYTAANYDYTKVYSTTPTYFDDPNYNFADRKSSNKDLYSVSGRVFSQGAYFDVPYGVTSITIEPYWGKAYYIADPNYDVVYKTDYKNENKQNVTQTGTQVTVGTTTFNEQNVETSIERALNYIANNLGGLGSTVYDNALVLVGNLHLATVPQNGTNHFTMMSVDKDNDHEPDYSLIYHHINRSNIAPIRFDFLNIPGTAQAQKPNGASLICNFTIFKTRGWFEVTNTAIVYSSQLEYENGDLGTGVTKIDAPLILLGGIFDQFVSTQSSAVNGKTIYIHMGSNVWINSFGLGTHSDGSKSTPHVPVSVTGGEYEGFYLTGTYNADAEVKTDNAECYISGGYFHEAAGASLEKIDGNVRWQIYNADIDNFFGGGTNDAKPITGDVTVDIYNSHVTTYCGGPKFGNMQTGKKVTTNAEGCTFGKYFGAGYGGTSLARKKYYDTSTTKWTDWAGKYVSDRGKYFDGKTTNAPGDAKYGKKGTGVATDFDYEFFVWSSGTTGGRFFVKFASFSLAQCNDVESNLTNCTINENFYGGGNLGKVAGNITSVLNGCKVKGNVFGAGFSASMEPLLVRDAGFTTPPNFNSSSGMFESGVFSGTTTFTWKNASEADVTLTNNSSGSDLTNHYIYTNTDISHTNLGSVDGNVTLTIKGNSVIGTSGNTTKGNVYGGGESSYVKGANHKVTVNLQGDTEVLGNVYGGGDEGLVEGSSEVNISNPTTNNNGSGEGTGEGSGSGSGN